MKKRRRGGIWGWSNWRERDKDSRIRKDGGMETEINRRTRDN